MRLIRKDNLLELVVFCMDYHSGQRSRGYRLLPLLQPRHLVQADIEECRQSACYAYLVDKYAEEV